jgi:hypothetical protein
MASLASIQNKTLPVPCADSGLARFLVTMGWTEPDRLLGMFTSYFDEAGGADHGFITVCGWVASVERWQLFEGKWKDMLSYFDVPYFHLKELSQCRGPYVKWFQNPGTQRDELFKEAARIICETVEYGFLSVVWYDAFRKTNERFHLKKHSHSPYAIAGRFCIARVNEWVKQQGRSLREVDYIFEDGGPDAGGLIDLTKRSDLKLPLFRSGRDTESQVGTVQLQAADYFAYELRKAVVDHRDPFTKPEMFRKSFQALFGCEVDQGNYDEAHLLNLCDLAKIPERIA